MRMSRRGMGDGALRMDFEVARAVAQVVMEQRWVVDVVRRSSSSVRSGEVRERGV